MNRKWRASAIAERDATLKVAENLRPEVEWQKSDIESLKYQLADREDYHQQYIAQGEFADLYDQEATLPQYKFLNCLHSNK